ncbi:MAG: FtsX-like permease family protein [Acidimicrobiales bacterium]
MRRLAFWLRWSGRDLRNRWVQVAAIALIIALGSGFYSGLSSTSAWRRQSYDASYRESLMYDLRLTLSTGSYLPAEQLRSIVAGIPSADQVAGSTVRLVGPVQVDASTADRTIIVPGTVVGIDLSTADQVSTLSTQAGRGLTPDDDGADVAVLDPHFVEFYGLPPTGTVTLSGGQQVDYVGTGLTPEYFLVMASGGHQTSSADFAVLFTSLTTAQSLLGQPGQANDLVLRVAPGADVDQVRAEVDQAMAAAAPSVGYTWTNGTDDPARVELYHGVASSQQLYTIFAALLLAGAAFGAFNLTVRIVEAQRREIGVAMALGTPRPQIAVRPLLLGLEVAVLGAVLGVGVGLLVDALFGSVVRRFQPLAVWNTSFQLDAFLRGAALGVVLPFVAVVIPVWSAVRVQPIDAIRTSAASARGVGLSPWLARLRLPGNSIAQLPVRNVLRSPRRSLLTVLGIAATITVLVALLGMVDSFYATIDVSRKVYVLSGTDRGIVTLDRFRLVDDPDVVAIQSSPVVARSNADIDVLGTVSSGSDSLDVVLSLIDMEHGIWVPPITRGSATDPGGGPGLVLTARAAETLGVDVGDTVTLHHPRREGATSYTFVDSQVPVVGITSMPLRYLAFMDIGQADLMQLQGTTNVMTVTPADGVSSDQFIRTLYALPAVGSVQTPAATVQAVSKQLDEILGILRIVDGALLLLAALIAFNSTSINLDERAREQATMFAFGLPVRTVLGIAVTESVITGVAGTLLGIATGRVLLTWMITRMLPSIVPDIGVVDHLAARTVWVALGLGLLAVSLAPMLSYRRLVRMDVPSTLRVME